MEFDKSQIAFPSETHREIWWWAIGIVPLETSLTDEVKEKCSPSVLKGCEQWHSYFQELCSDMYVNVKEYMPASPRMYRDFLENISAKAELSDDGLMWGLDGWRQYLEKTNKSKPFRTAGITLERCVTALERTGLEVREHGQSVTIRNTKYPNIFHAMKVMENSPNVRDTQTRWHFAHCEFRQLFKSFTPGYNDLLRKASDEVLHIADELHSFAKEIKVQRYIHFGIIKYKYKDNRIFDYTLRSEDTPSMRLNMRTCVKYRDTSDVYFDILNRENDAVKKLFRKGLVRCSQCRGDCGHEHAPVDLGCFGSVCVCQDIRLCINPVKDDLPQLYRLILARKEAIEHAMA